MAGCQSCNNIGWVECQYCGGEYECCLIVPVRIPKSICLLKGKCQKCQKCIEGICKKCSGGCPSKGCPSGKNKEKILKKCICVIELKFCLKCNNGICLTCGLSCPCTKNNLLRCICLSVKKCLFCHAILKNCPICQENICANAFCLNKFCKCISI